MHHWYNIYVIKEDGKEHYMGSTKDSTIAKNAVEDYIRRGYQARYQLSTT